MSNQRLGSVGAGAGAGAASGGRGASVAGTSTDPLSRRGTSCRAGSGRTGGVGSSAEAAGAASFERPAGVLAGTSTISIAIGSARGVSFEACVHDHTSAPVTATTCAAAEIAKAVRT